jgi:hypothetical protein
MAKQFAFTVKRSRFDEKAAYNHDRPISGLIRTQLLHLQTVEQHLNPGKRTNVNINNLATEKQASEYIQRVTALLHEHGKPARGKTAGKKTKVAKKAVKKTAKRSSKKHLKSKLAAKKRK